ncbi:hypothetical protein NL676_037357 [Syzygium grande]|nr:hypothetical protein NL676_037357 [Syzygium grande]
MGTATGGGGCCCGGRFVLQVLRGRWFMMFASFLIMAGAGATYLFGVYSKDIKSTLGRHAAAGTAGDGGEAEILRRWISRRSRFSPLLKQSLENSHRSGTTFLNPCQKERKKKPPKRFVSSDAPDGQEREADHFQKGGGGQNGAAYVGVELADEAGEVVVLEAPGEEVAGKGGGVPDDEGGAVVAPRDDVIDGGVVDELVGLGEEGCGGGPLGLAAGRGGGAAMGTTDSGRFRRRSGGKC